MLVTVVDLGELDQRTVLHQYKVLAEHLYPNISLIVRSHLVNTCRYN